MARRRYFGRRRRGRGGFTLPIAPVLGLAAGLVPGIKLAMSGDPERGIRDIMASYTGFDYETGVWNPSWMLRGIVPLAVGLLVHKFIGGPPLNLNQTLARAKVPIIRI